MQLGFSCEDREDSGQAVEALLTLRREGWLELSGSDLSLPDLLLTLLVAPLLMLSTGSWPWRISLADDPQEKTIQLYLVQVLHLLGDLHREVKMLEGCWCARFEEEWKVMGQLII